ncbi:MAG: tRNA preQ1(34) S-adenosylmethionine ribosyltransferase-isomerase QueA [Treponema sp.]|jgi:S-adenosylmethionine:tRNA ribosyltransferase-isomerase|nr:tRNA preQ1(34) S-adenosylmethionine ribosyltransferase-isomerase QueA [Treponema sp.]
MLTKDFYFDLPSGLIAQYPSAQRGADRLMTLDRKTGETGHHRMDDLPSLVPAGAFMVFNDSKVRKSRLYAIKESTGAKTEFLFISPLSSLFTTLYSSQWRVMVRNARKHKSGDVYRFPDGTEAEILPNAALEGTEFRELGFRAPLTEDWFEQNGHIPLPPYISREDNAFDAERYQTVYAKEMGSAACPTAGLHFTEAMLRCLADAGIETAWVTLHVGLGTFLPVRTERLEDHTMHQEVYTVSEETAGRVNAAKQAGRPVLAVGTTSVRTLESAYTENREESIEKNGGVRAGEGATSIFIYPGYRFRVADALFTNFHTPESTLLMLVSAFAGREHILNAYQAAVEQRYRFFSYGDAMLIV